MKRVKIKVLCAIILLVSAASLHCMFIRRGASWRPATSGMSREAAARLAAIQQKERLSTQASGSLPVRDTSTWSNWFQSGVDRLKSLFQRSSVQSEVVQPISYAARTRTMPLGARGYSTMPVSSDGESKREKTSSNELVEATDRSYVAPAKSKPGWLSGRAAQETYDYFLKSMNDLKNGKKIGMSTIIILVQYIQQSNYNPINIADEDGHSFYYYLLKNFKDRNKDSSYLNAIKQDINHCKSLGAELNGFDREEMSKDIQNDSDLLVRAIKDENLIVIYDIACGFQVYDFAGLDDISNTINKDSMNEYIAECRKDPSLFKKLVEYGNVVRSYQKDPQPYRQPERYYQSIADKILEDYNKYQAFLPIYSFSKTFDMDKAFAIGVLIWRGQGTTIRSKKTIQEMVSQGELLDYIQEDVFKNPVVEQAIDNYKWWVFSRTEPRVMDEKTKEEDRFYGKDRESNYLYTGKRVINFTAYEELKELLKQDIQNKVAHLQRLHDDFMALARSIKQGGSSMDRFNAMYKDLVSFDNIYIPNELMFKDLMQEYHPDKLKFKVESGEMAEKDAETIKDKIAKLISMRTAYQKEQLAKE